jgi:2,4-didehydro-3-deoxy-L-rhamnonate hydrolase
MKFFSYIENNGTIRPGLTYDEKYYSLFPKYHSLMEFIQKHQNDLNTIEKLCKNNELEEIKNKEAIKYAPPIVSPNKLICVAGNYIDHVKEGGIDPNSSPEIKQAPWMFLVPPSTVMVGHNQRVIYPNKANCIDYEGELAFIISKHAKDVPEEKALDYVFGYTIFNDVSERKPFMTENVQKPRDLSFWYKKSFDTFGPIGPMVTPAVKCNPHELKIESFINEELKQSCETSKMIFKIPKLIEFLSSFMTLEPGDIVSTGTPSGVGAASGQYLKKGDTMKIQIEGLGILENSIT